MVATCTIIRYTRAVLYMYRLCCALFSENKSKIIAKVFVDRNGNVVPLQREIGRGAD